MLFDSNLIIYAAQPEHASLRNFIAREVPCVSVVSKVETLGYHALEKEEKRLLAAFFDAADVLPVSDSTVSAAIRLRQKRRMSLGDALIAGTALSYGLELATRNVEDFLWIDELVVFDPFSSS
ncbi:MAG: PIN domain-containing protein [Bacteroidetes bacterium]|jgi:predicted nucleic acid-binding protein|nr:PIN domain-containing protein [Bacteroidota bacterium]